MSSSLNLMTEEDIRDLRMMIRAVYEVPHDKVIVIDSLSLLPKQTHNREVYEVEHRVVDKTD